MEDPILNRKYIFKWWIYHIQDGGFSIAMLDYRSVQGFIPPRWSFGIFCPSTRRVFADPLGSPYHAWVHVHHLPQDTFRGLPTPTAKIHEKVGDDIQDEHMKIQPSNF